ncbi:MAG: RdgB/HAM1 family non-canonical purine NTP pyrophosphatase, partial [Bdellovibrionaceae bacterium]|nr:RdgB/HAM1 family non-canonical purine NTP pyrophosphatase [Pseudobdellovibrionaceae bacterium]
MGGKKQLWLASTNNGKAREVREILGPGWEIQTMKDLAGAPAVEETGKTFLENARLKALALSVLVDGWVLADDSGLEVEALGGAPGVLSARYAGVPGDDAANVRKLLAAMAGVPDAQRAARFVCAMVLAHGDKVQGEFQGYWPGRIGMMPRGTHGFGYDPVFFPAGETRTAAELEAEEKNRVSHRGAGIKAGDRVSGRTGGDRKEITGLRQRECPWMASSPTPRHDMIFRINPMMSSRARRARRSRGRGHGRSVPRFEFRIP